MPVVVALHPATRIARQVERVDVSLLPRGGGLVPTLADEPLHMGQDLPETPLH